MMLEAFLLKRTIEIGCLKLGLLLNLCKIIIPYLTLLEPLHGMHFQAQPAAQGKLVRCARGAIFDVAVDIRRGSPTYGEWEGHELTAKNGHQLYVPIGFAHGFVTLEPDSEIVYKCTDYYAPETEGTVRWDRCGIDWPLSGDPILSDKDAVAPALGDFESPFIYGENS